MSQTFPTFRYYFLNSDEFQGLVADGLTAAALVVPTQGGTGHKTYEAGDLLVADTPTTLKKRRLDDGQVLVGVTGDEPAAVQLQSGHGIEISNDPGAVTIAAKTQVYKAESSTDDVMTGVTGTTRVPIADMTLTPGEGDFLIFFNAWATSATNIVNFRIFLYLDGVEIPGTMRRYHGALDDKVGASTMAYVTGVTPGQTIEARWNCLNASETNVMKARTLIAQRVN